MRTRIFYDFEATSVARDADIISIGLVAVTGGGWDKSMKTVNRHLPLKEETKTFYAEFIDFNLDKCDDWVKENVVSKLIIEEPISANEMVLNNEGVNVRYKGDSDVLSFYLKQWLSQFEEIEFWADYDTIDKPMLVDLIADWDYSLPCGFISKSACHYEESKRAYVCDRCNEARDKDCQHKIGLPKHLPNVNYYDFYDLHTLFKIKGIAPDIDRNKFCELTQVKHNALQDAWTAYRCYNKLMSI